MQISYIVPDQTQGIKVLVGQILKIDSENSCIFCARLDPSNSEDSKVAQNEEIPRDFCILSNFANSEGARIEVIPRDVFILSDFARFEVPQNEDVCKGIGYFLSFRIAKVARIEDVYEGLSYFWTIAGLVVSTWGPKLARKDSLSLYMGNPYIEIP